MSNWNPEHIGVTTSATSLYERSNFDVKMAKEFNPVYVKCGPPKPHQYEAFRIYPHDQTGIDQSRIIPPDQTGTQSHYADPSEMYSSYRSDFDKAMLMKWNSLYRKNQMVREAYQPSSSCAYQPPHSKIYDDPYNKFLTVLCNQV